MAETQRATRSQRDLSSDFAWKNLVILAGLSLLALLVMGYHPGLEDDSFYLAAIKRDLHPALFTYDSDFFRVQFQATIFDKVVALSVRTSHLTLAWMILLEQCAAIFFFLLGCWRIARRSFEREEAQWSAVAMIAALLTIPVSGIAINLFDQYLHPRALATALILAAVVAVLDRKWWLVGLLLAIAFAIHALMTCFGISFCLFLAWFLHRPRTGQSFPELAGVAALVPLGWLFAPASDAWRQAASTRGFYYVNRWEWYEWLGVFAPLLLFYVFQRFLERRELGVGRRALLPLVSAVLWYGIVQMLVGLLLVLPSGLERLRPFEPMRYLHLVYVFLFLMIGGVLGHYVLGRHRYRWVLLFLPLSAGMFYAQRQMYSASAHLELPFLATENPWVRAFDWIRLYTPADAVFAVYPHYETLPAEDYHGFRALAERSVLADYEKDGGMAARVPPLAPRWLKEVTALKGWRTFQAADFERLKKDFGVTWFVLSRADAQFASPQHPMVCPYANEQVKVCRLY